MSVPENTPVICKNCGHTFTGKYCNNCGEKVYTRHDSTIIHLVEESAHFITHFEGSFFNTLKALTVPGKLSTDYCGGIRKKYFKPISFFLLIVVIFLLFPVVEGLNQRLYNHMQNPLYGNFAAKKVAKVLQHTGLTMEQLSEKFHEKAEKVSKFLLLILIPASALILQAFTFRKRRLFFDQVILATEINIVCILVGFLLAPLITNLVFYVFHFLNGAPWQTLDIIMGIFFLLLMMIYVAIAAKRFYKLKFSTALLLAIAFMMLYAFFFQFIYKFLLFISVIWQVH